MYAHYSAQMGAEMKVVGTCSEEMIRMLKEKGIDADTKQIPLFDSEEIIKKVKGYECWINVGNVCPKEVIDRLAPTLKMICRCGIGYDQIDVDYATKKGICVTNTAGSMNESVGEAAALLILEVMRKFYLYNRRLLDGNWYTSVPANSLIGKTIGFVGFGGIGRSCAELLQGFHCKFLVYDKYVSEEILKQYQAEAVELDELAARSDVVTIHCPLTPETKGLIDFAFLSRMKPTAYLVNTARGPVVREQDLIRALKQGLLAGAGLDVYETEPVEKDNPLLSMEQVIALPHVASRTAESQWLTQHQAAENIRQFLDGKRPMNCLNPDYVTYIQEG